MNKTVLTILISIGLGFAAVATTKHFWRGDVMSSAEVRKRWGDHNLDPEKFKSGNETIRAAMAFSILESKSKFLGKFVDEVRTELGNPDGFYFSDVYPAYIIQSTNSLKGEAWQIVFSLDNARKVTDIFVHKNCCK